MFFDLFTGILVSRKEKKEAEKLKPELKNESLITSKKLKLGFVKFLLYGSSILIAYNLQEIAKIHAFNFSFSDLKFSITMLIILSCCVVEIYSIFFENFKKLGFDILKIASKIIDTYRKGKSKITE
jgi:hypothetical protein